MDESIVLQELTKLCEKVEPLSICGWWIEYGGLPMMCVIKHSSLRISMPTPLGVNDYGKDLVVTVINELNNELRFVKFSLNRFGSININYDHCTLWDESPDIVRHILDTVSQAASYLGARLAEATSLRVRITAEEMN